MKLSRADADVFVPDGLPIAEALARTTHLAIGAHQDDLEFMALHGILECVDSSERWFAGVTVTDGSGSPRCGPFAHCSDSEMRAVRFEEQREAARLGRYGCQIQLGHPSAELKSPDSIAPVDDLVEILRATRPQTVYLHNPADRHDTHVACCLRAIEALRLLPAGARSQTVYGCEVWRDLDWLPFDRKVALPLDDPRGLGLRLAAVFASQIAGGKHYDLAVEGRRLANATFFESHTVDRHALLSFAMDLTPLVLDDRLGVADLTGGVIDLFRDDVIDRIGRMSGER